MGILYKLQDSYKYLVTVSGASNKSLTNFVKPNLLKIKKLLEMCGTGKLGRNWDALKLEQRSAILRF